MHCYYTNNNYADYLIYHLISIFAIQYLRTDRTEPWQITTNK